MKYLSLFEVPPVFSFFPYQVLAHSDLSALPPLGHPARPVSPEHLLAQPLPLAWHSLIARQREWVLAYMGLLGQIDQGVPAASCAVFLVEIASLKPQDYPGSVLLAAAHLRQGTSAVRENDKPRSKT